MEPTLSWNGVLTYLLNTFFIAATFLFIFIHLRKSSIVDKNNWNLKEENRKLRSEKEFLIHTTHFMVKDRVGSLMCMEDYGLVKKCNSTPLIEKVKGVFVPSGPYEVPDIFLISVWTTGTSRDVYYKDKEGRLYLCIDSKGEIYVQVNIEEVIYDTNTKDSGKAKKREHLVI